jgi:cyclophilin family peptidyl-prolyl cis-trans isomerase
MRTCGEDLTSPAALEVTLTNVVLAGDSRKFTPCPGGAHPPTHREVRESAVLTAATVGKDPALRRAAAQAWGKLGPMSVGTVNQPGAAAAGGATFIPHGPLVSLLEDQVPAVRMEAARAFVRALDGVPGERLLEAADVRPDPSLVEWARQHLTGHLAKETDNDVAAAVMETLGMLRYADDRQRDEVEALLAGLATGSPPRVFGAVKGLEGLIRLNPKRNVRDTTIARLRQVAVTSGGADLVVRARRLALMALQTARDADLPTLTAAAKDPDWQVRRLVALRVDASRPELDGVAALLARDTAFQVRYEMLTPIARRAADSHDCAALLAALDDPAPTVVLRALDVLPAGCREQDAIVKKVDGSAAGLRSATETSWHVPARALTALGRLSPKQATTHLPTAIAHAAWQVRATAAGVAATLGDTGALDLLARDRHANVQTAVLEGLRRMKAGYRALMDTSLLALDGTDHQLLRTAAMTMPDPGVADREKAVKALLGALQRLTAVAADTSRDPRTAIVQKLATVLQVDSVGGLFSYMGDYDPRVRAAVSAALAKVIGSLPSVIPKPQHRYPLQPASLAALPATARITMADGATIDLELLVDDAPVTIARFAALARGGYYNGLTFHRIAPNFVVQGGSPGANEYAGAARYMRDEIGAHHVRGAVGISTRGRDTGDLQIFIDHVDVPRLDHEYTVFARVLAGMQHVDAMLEGATIRTVTVK